MKPIRLEVEGLQSYIEPVVVDFESLGRYGLFGIFGPIGSGKSSLLDALTLALYGLVDRVAGRSKKGVINADAERMEVRLTFSVRTAEGVAETYEVHRSYRSTSDHSGSGVQRIASRLSQHSDGGVPCEPPLVLADKEREVNDTVAAIVGLCAEDFMRAVVLPQGRFLDVLHLKGSERRGMLQRIFRLSAYGAHLRTKLRSRQQEQREQLAAIDGELHGLGPATRADVRGAKQALEQHREARIRAGEALDTARQHHDAAERARRQHGQLTEALAQLSALEEQAEAVAAQRTAIADAEALLPQRGPMSRWIRARERGVAARNRQDHTARELEKASLALHAAEDELEAIRARHDATGPALVEELRALEEAARRLGANSELESALALAVQRSASARERRAEIDEELARCRAELSTLHPHRASLKRRLKIVRVQLEERRHVTEAVEAHRLLSSARSAHENSIEAQHQAEQALASREEEEAAAREAAAESQAMLQAAEARRSEMPAASTEASPLLEVGAERVAALATCRDRLAEARASEADAEARHHAAQESDAAAQEQLVAAQLALAQQLEAQRRHAAAHLATELAEGEACPVCGSEAHPHPAVPPASEVPHEVDVDPARQEALRCSAGLAAAHATLEAARERTRAAQGALDSAATALRDLLPAEASSEADALLVEAREAIRMARAEADRVRHLAEERERLDAELQELRLEAERALAPVHAASAHTQRARSDLSAAHERVDTAAAAVGQAWSQWSEVAGEHTTLFDVPQLQQRIDARDAETRDLERSLTEAELRRENLQQAIADGQHDRGHAVTDIAEADLQRDRLQERWATLRSDVLAILTPDASPHAPGEPVAADEASESAPLSALADAVHERRIAVERTHREQVRSLADAVARREAARAAHAAAHTAAATATEAVEGALHAIGEAWSAWVEADPTLAPFGSEAASVDPLPRDVDQELRARSARVEEAPGPEELARWREAVATHMEQTQRLEARVDALSDGTRPPSDEAFAVLAEALRDASEAAERCAEAATRAQATHDDLVKRLGRVERLQEEREKAAVALERLEHLGLLLRGDRFVEFVANDLLRELAATATQHLRTLSEGRYALTLDEQGGFLVQDADAGGTTRPVTSLSGGESFLSALALALALSTQIQARGAKPLEFFFLDEGFGSLDPEALDRVMSAIERLRDDQRIIGLISHVPGVRERIPVHLVVHPAGSRQQGSSVEMRIQ